MVLLRLAYVVDLFMMRALLLALLLLMLCLCASGMVVVVDAR